MKKLYVWVNTSGESPFVQGDNIYHEDRDLRPPGTVEMPYGSDAHSGGIVILADSPEEAKELFLRQVGKPENPDAEWFRKWKANLKPPVELPADVFTHGEPLHSGPSYVILYCDGGC